ncbi:L-proline glycine betaine ABC transport system permease protein ProW [Desulfocucumis palustris]|uniref:L-proline glycine betaine ABC transport system permease protein ProW n=1 Tax=Desulfocucumis palustris TaxID=1898651 RepID=A0A2L2XFG4_9FIRM|nr:ABC transporter substrate-binding protein [Desulfocucumis palustris]GBF32591.1 L-proline glycine betaine ABC transport system permease protein ProW [Desulfocucumis palustris]
MSKKSGIYRWWKSFLLLSLLLLLWLIPGGCGDSGEKNGTENSGEKKKIVFGDFSWDSAQVHNRVAGFIVEHGYGYPVDYLFGETVPILQGLGKGNVDATMEIWVQNVQEAYQKLIDSGEVTDLGPNFPDSPQGWYVPTYVIKGDSSRGIKPMAPDLKSVSDLPKYRQLFKDAESPDKGRFYNSPPGWVVTDINGDKIKAYGLDKYYSVFSTGSDSALSTSIVSAYEQGKPWLGYYWEPTWIMGKLDMTMLAEPPYDEKLWNTNHGCSFPPTEVHVAVNSKLEKTAPELVDFLDNYNTTLEQTNSALAYMHDNGVDARAAAIWYLRQYPDVWRTWVPSNVAQKVEGALKEVK